MDRETLGVAKWASAGEETFLLLAVGLGLGLAGTEVEAEATAEVALVFGFGSFFFFGAGTILPARSAPFLPAVVEAGGGMEPRSEAGLVDGWRTADATAMGITGDGETWRGSLAEVEAGLLLLAVAGVAGGRE